MLREYTSFGWKDWNDSQKPPAPELWRRLRASELGVATPCFAYDLDAVERNAASFLAVARGRAEVLFATMANPRPDVLTSVRKAGLGAFVNSGLHFRRVLETGVAPQMVMYAGAGHDDQVLNEVASSGCMYVADSVAQWRAYAQCQPRGLYGVRVNVGSLLGLPESQDPAPRLGLTLEEVRSLTSEGPIQILHVYVGTNLETPKRHLAVIDRLVTLADELEGVEAIDLGGGFALSPSDIGPGHYWEVVLDAWTHSGGPAHGLRLIIEPGRSIVRTAGFFFVTTTDVKQRGDRRYIVVDSSATWYPRKLVHDADDHRVTLANRPVVGELKQATICGSTTFSGDILADVLLPTVEPGDVLAFETAGAYCEAMHLDFLGMAPPAVWLLNDGRFNLATMKDSA